MLKLWSLVIPLAIMGCKGEAVDAAATSKARNDKRVAKAEVALGKTPVPRTYTIQGNQLQVIEVPVADTSGFVDQQRCFIYRDAEFKTSSISCESRPEVVIKDSN